MTGVDVLTKYFRWWHKETFSEEDIRLFEDDIRYLINLNLEAFSPSYDAFVEHHKIGVSDDLPYDRRYFDGTEDELLMILAFLNELIKKGYDVVLSNFENKWIFNLVELFELVYNKMTAYKLNYGEAERILDEVVDITINELRHWDPGLSPADLMLESCWDEIVFQQQDGESIYWESSYCPTINSFLEADLGEYLEKYNGEHDNKLLQGLFLHAVTYGNHILENDEIYQWDEDGMKEEVVSYCFPKLLSVAEVEESDVIKRAYGIQQGDTYLTVQEFKEEINEKHIVNFEYRETYYVVRANTMDGSVYFSEDDGDTFVIYDNLDTLLNDAVVEDMNGDEQPLKNIIPFVCSFE